jgi:serine/threonine protein kinase
LNFVSFRSMPIFDWQAGRRETTSGAGTRITVEDTLQAGLSGDKQSVIYLAPEATASGAFDPVKLDIFALGAVAYHIVTGQPPAQSLEDLHRKLSEGRGLRVSDVMDGAADDLQELIELSTDPSVEDRPDSVGEFLDLLGGAERDLAAPEPDQTVHPLDARIGDRLQQGFVVKKRLGKGATSLALLVERDDQEGVLKVALDPSQNERLRHEGEVLRKLRHQNIVELYEDLEINGHAALFMAKAGAESTSGTYTLAQRIREEGRLSLDLL